MKAFGGGQLWNVKTSPLKKALTEYQCIPHVLDKPGVLTALNGICKKADLDKILGFCHAAPEEKDDFILGSFAPQDAAGKRVYCAKAGGSFSSSGSHKSFLSVMPGI